MSAAATAAGYLYAHRRLPAAGHSSQAGAEPPHHTAESRPSRRAEPQTVPWQGESQPAKEARTPRIEYRKRRFYPLPSAA